MEQDFPISSFLEIKKHLGTERKNFEKDKAIWTTVRASLTDAEANQLDEQFKTIFETTTDPQLLEQLVQKGASARLLENYELGSYNLAMVVQELADAKNNEELEIAAGIIRTTIIAGADINRQKAYWGNGGRIAIDWLSIYLARASDRYGFLSTMDQYHYCYRIFTWIAVNTAITEDMHGDIHPLYGFLICLKNAPEVEDLQEKLILQMMALDWHIFAMSHEDLTTSFFSRIVNFNPRFLTLIVPYEHEQLKSYLDIVQKNIGPMVIKNFLNGFTSNNKARKYFRAFFSLRPHWLLKLILSGAPETVFNLVKRNEQDLLIPFLKHYKREIAELKDENNHTLLQHAMTSRKVVENTIQLLRQYGQ
ncbi:hypothetical protein [Chitinophaga filiformis]|uniref:Uncharacterized protein n=1 Tax=Chitinophaga filiformis TaxID=104663 RepID=A0A1G7VS27_CHIFI|nr:hypothetical protein [Chitinophaga filiformis]SDG61700.1 hypothetical protein SAMN04488121_105208 [Chitinophaga filiformis]